MLTDVNEVGNNLQCALIYSIYNKTGFQWKKCKIKYYKIHDICIEEVSVAKYFSKETII